MSKQMMYYFAVTNISLIRRAWGTTHLEVNDTCIYCEKYNNMSGALTDFKNWVRLYSDRYKIHMLPRFCAKRILGNLDLERGQCSNILVGKYARIFNKLSRV